MIPHLRQHFNKSFTEEKYQRFLRRLDEACGVHIEFRVSETPLFIPETLLHTMQSAGKEIVQQLMLSSEYLGLTEKTIPAEYKAPNETPHPMMLAVDFGIVRREDGSFVPKLIELQGFPSLYGFQVELSAQYMSAYGLPTDLKFMLNGLSVDEYYVILRRVILGGHSPDNVILMELDPLTQKTRPDFLLTERICGIRTVNVRDVIKEGRRLFYKWDGKAIPIHRIYNRAIVDELKNSGAQLSFSFRDELEVEWVCHPNWFFKLSKFSLPFLNHPTVPRTYFLNDLKETPSNLEQWVLKPLYSFAGSGVIVGPTKADIDAVPEEQRADYVLQERVEYAPLVETPFGGTKAEVRILFLWEKELVPVSTLVRMGRGKMMGVSFNKDLSWVGSSAGFFL